MEKVLQSKGCSRNRLVKKMKKTKKAAFPFHCLPTDVICGILSQLPFKEAARTSIVSRDWRRLWTCYPELVLTRETMLGSNAAIAAALGEHPSSSDAATFIGRVNSIVRQLPSSSSSATTTTTTLSKFVVKFPLVARDAADHIDRWVSLSAASRARCITLDLCPPEATTGTGRDDEAVLYKYSFPLHLFNGSSGVKSLSLGFVSLKLPPAAVPNGFTNLKKLALHRVSIAASGDVRCLLPECDVLEWLSLTQCSLHPYLIIHQPLQRLRYLRVLDCRLHRLELQAPNLVEFEFTNYPTPFTLGDCRSLSMACIGLFSAEYSFGYACTELPAALPHVQDRLSISMVLRCTQAQVSVVKGGTPVFGNLRHLVLDITLAGYSTTGTGILQLACLLELAPVLEELEIHMSYDYEIDPPYNLGHLDDTEITSAQMTSLHKHLRAVHMTGFYAVRGQLELARHILRSTAALERMVIDPNVKFPEGRSPREFPPEMYYPSRGRFAAKWSLKHHDFPGTVITVL